jgi:hypothetical protein
MWAIGSEPTRCAAGSLRCAAEVPTRRRLLTDRLRFRAKEGSYLEKLSYRISNMRPNGSGRSEDPGIRSSPKALPRIRLRLTCRQCWLPLATLGQERYAEDHNPGLVPD